MTGGNKKKALRQCAVCKKIGHNRSTCPERNVVVSKPATNPTSQPSPLKLFVHHTTNQPDESAHKLNLKESTGSVWDKVQSAAPAATKNPAYYFHHQENSFPAIPPEAKSGEEIAAELERLLPAQQPKESIPVRILYENRTFRQRLYDIPFHLKQILSRPAKPATPKKIEPIVKTGFAPSAAKLKPHKPLNLKKLVRYGALLGGVALLILAFFPLKNYLVDLSGFKTNLQTEAQAGFTSLQNSAHALLAADWQNAQDQNNAALEHFSKALRLLDTHHRVLQTVANALPVVKNYVLGREKLLLAGQTLALGNQHLLSPLATMPATSSTPERLLALARASRNAIPLYEQAINELGGVDASSVPNEYRSDFEKYRGLLNKAHNDLTEAAALTELIPDIFGGEGRRRYLVVFQNPAELRATGGFMGSFAFLELYNGEIKKLDVPKGGTYDLQGQLNAFVEPPAPLLLANRRWEFQDANWFPDWTASAKKIAWFYRHSRGISVDGVMAVNASVLPKLLVLLGPINDQERQITWAASTSLQQLQNLVEYGPEKLQNQPKAVIGDLAAVIAERLANLKDPAILSGLLATLNQALVNKDIQLAFFDERLAALVHALNWDGSIAEIQPNQDYLLVVNSNIQGKKSDVKVIQNISHEAVVDDSGAVNVTVTITRKHTGMATDTDYGATNISYVRVYVPRGSQLTKAEGFTWPEEKAFKAPLAEDTQDSDLLSLENFVSTDQNSGTQIMESFGKTVFGNWVITEPGATSQVVFTYRLPFQVALHAPAASVTSPERWLGAARPVPYQLVVEKQAGANSSFDSKVIFPTSFETLWVSGPDAIAARNGLTVSSNRLTSDRVYSLLTKEN